MDWKQTAEILVPSSFREIYLKYNNPILYYQIIGPGFHEALLGFTRPCNSFELMHLVGSEWKSDNFEKGLAVDSKYLYHISLREFGVTKPMTVDLPNTAYDWQKLADSIQEEGFKTPLIVEVTNSNHLIVFEGKHRYGACSLIKPFDLDLLLPCLVVMRDIDYTIKMWKQPHPNAFSEDGFSTYPER